MDGILESGLFMRPSIASRQTLLIKAPPGISSPTKAFSVFFSELHKLVKDQPGLSLNDKILSFELILKENYFSFQLNSPYVLIPVVSSLIYSHFQDLEILSSPDFQLPESVEKELFEIRLERSAFFPLKTETNLKLDPYITLAALVSQLDTFNEGISLQFLLKPFSESWARQLLRERLFSILGTLNDLKSFISKPFLEKEPINYYQEVKRKFNSKIFNSNIRVLIYGTKKSRIQSNLNFLKKAFSSLENGDINAPVFHPLPISQLPIFWERKLSPNPLLLNSEEIAAFYHFPDQTLQITNVNHLTSKRIEPPISLPKAVWLKNPTVSTFGMINFRDSHLPFGIKRSDRNRHLYIIGKTGMGKTKLIELLAISDIRAGKGLCIIDPHGDLAVDILRYIPESRIRDTIYFNPADSRFPIGLNPLACFSPEAKYQVVTGFIGIFRKLFAAGWSNRLEHMLRFIVLALVEAGDTTVIDIVRLLSEVGFRQQVIAKLKDPVVRNFWTHEFAAWNEKFDNEAIIPIINQVGQFIANDYIRNVVGQKRSAVDIFEAMQSDKILIINLAKGKLGEENTALLGSMIISKIQEATMARVNIPESRRNEFYLYVDEFQHFATEAFNQILSEARKFNLSLTIAHQYLDQLTDSIRKTVFGNVGSFVSFRVGPEDAQFLTTEFRPQLTPEDFINLDSRNLYVKLSIDGKTSTPFSAVTVNVKSPSSDYSREVIRFSQEHFGTPRSELSKIFSQKKESWGMISGENDYDEINDDEFEPPIV